MSTKRKTVIIAGAAVLALGAGAGVTALLAQPAPEADAAQPTTETVAAEEGALTERVEAKGKLSFGGAQEVGTQLQGTITSMPKAGSLIGLGNELMRVDDKPVTLMHGALPAWRTLEPGMTRGKDVQQLEQNLAALGFFEYEPDDIFDWNTQYAIGNWEEALGMPRTGKIDLGRVVFSPGDLRVAEQKSREGSAASASAFTATGTVKTVTADVAPELRDLLQEGTEVDLALPDGTQTKGTVTGVGAPVEREDKSGQKSLKLPVTVALADQAAAEAFSDVSVGLSVTKTVRENALTVPVRALLAQPGGGYAVDVQTGTKIKRVPVELGAFASGNVEVTGGKLRKGDNVVVSE
ncbi:peptidoglycan-binding protein [Leucobacter sp. HY1910]